MVDPAILTALVGASPPADRLDPDARSALLAVLTAPIAWSWLDPPRGREHREPLARRLRSLRLPPPAVASWLGGLAGAGHDADVLDRLIADGWLAPPWPIADLGVAVTLSPLAAERIGVELGELGGLCDPVPCWAPIDPRPRPIRLTHREQIGVSAEAHADLLIDPRAGPVETAIANEEAARVLTTEVVDECGRPVLDMETGKPILTTVRLFGREIPIVSKLGGKGTPRPKAKVKAKVKAKPPPKREPSVNGKPSVNGTPHEDEPQRHSFAPADLRERLDGAAGGP